MLTGRFGNGEYWNGYREEASTGSAGWQLANGTPRVVLRSLLLAVNSAIYDGDAGALRQLDNLLYYAGTESKPGGKASRRQLMFDLLDMSTLRIVHVPEAPADGDAKRVCFDIGPVAITDKMTLEFIPSPEGGWRLMLPDAATLAAHRSRFLSALGHDNMEALNQARANSPRAALREFIQGARTWHDGGRQRALAVMDLSLIPESRHNLEGPIYADFLRRIIDRVAYVIWQEVPDDPQRSVPYVYFQHPAGNITLVQVMQPAADAQPPQSHWMISSGTLSSAPALLAAMQTLPMIGGLENPQPLSPYFQLREKVRGTWPELISVWGHLEIWQWIGLVATLLASILAAVLTAGLLRLLSKLWHKRKALAKLAVPSGFLMASLMANWGILRLGVTQAGIPLVSALTGVLLVLGIAVFAYRLVAVAGGWVHDNASKTSSYSDEIATSLATGFLKLLIVVASVIMMADVVGLPYEGVLTGLGVGGVAIAFAARDTVSNMIGGGLLIADRPVQRGDVIELDGNLATGEKVGLRSTRLRGLDNTLLYVPNSHLSDRLISNWGKRHRRKVFLPLGFTYDTPRERLDTFVHRLREVVLQQPKVDPSDIYVGLKGFGASSIDIDLICHLRVFDYGSQVEEQHKLILDIIALADDIGISFAFPTRTLYMAASCESAPIFPPQAEPEPEASS